MAVELARADRNLVASAYGAYQSLSYQSDDTALQAAIDRYRENSARVIERLTAVETNLPATSAAIDPMIERAKTIVKMTDDAVASGAKGWITDAKRSLSDADAQIVDLSNDIAALSDQFKQRIGERSADLRRQTDMTITTSLAFLGILFGAGIIGALLVVSRGITAPIDRLRKIMIALADGNIEVSVGQEIRRDEVGQMAAAVAIFRDNAREKLRLEQEATESRSISEQERLQREAFNARNDAEIRLAVHHVGLALGHLADGQVSHRIDVPFAANLDALRSDFNNSVANLQDVLQAVEVNAHGIDTGANEIRAAADNLSKRTEQQASLVEQTAAALEEMTKTVKDASHRAEQAGDLVGKTREGAERSGEIVESAISAMNEIKRSSSEITNIISVIDEIAFQTNLLALNAGVEAARAGDSGKGFAVVAHEVRELAQRSAKAAKEIKSLITISGEHVQTGVALVGNTGVALKEIVTEVQEINRHVGAIVQSSREQAAGIEEINRAVNLMDRGTQQNAAMVEQSTAASRSLAAEAAALSQLLLRFNHGTDNKSGEGFRGSRPSIGHPNMTKLEELARAS
ncbi:methyl-accepting chemotaxis protein [Rhizobium ruizarguesonis]